jgi:hypothetical protein
MWVCFAYLEKRWFATSLIGGISCGDTLSRCIIKQMTKPIPTVWAVCVSVLSMFQFDLSSNFILTLWCDLQPWRMHHSLGHASIYKRKIILLCTLMVILIIQHNSLSVGVCFFFFVESSLQYRKLILFVPGVHFLRAEVYFLLESSLFISPRFHSPNLTVHSSLFIIRRSSPHLM